MIAAFTFSSVDYHIISYHMLTTPTCLARELVGIVCGQEFDLNAGGLVGAVAAIDGTGQLVTGDFTYNYKKSCSENAWVASCAKSGFCPRTYAADPESDF